jgi:hypothetical protein
MTPPDDSTVDSATMAFFRAKFERLPGVRSLVIYAAEGSHLVPIHLTSAGAASRNTDVSRATGYSSNFNFDEAFRAAIAQVTIRSP